MEILTQTDANGNVRTDCAAYIKLKKVFKKRADLHVGMLNAKAHRTLKEIYYIITTHYFIFSCLQDTFEL